jgi:suppressor for copper-sensitivity B
MLLVVLPDSVHAASTAWIGDKNAKARLVSGVQATGSGSRIDVGLEIQMAPGWHTYWRTPGDAGFAPIIDWKNSLNLASAKIAWPAPTRLSIEGLETNVYPDHVLLPIAVTLSDPGRPLELRASVDYAACKEICVPYHADLYLELPSGLATISDEMSLIATARAKVPSSLEAASIALLALTAAPVGERSARVIVRLRSDGALFRRPDLFVEGLHHGQAGPPAIRISDNGRVVELVVQVSDSTTSALTAIPLSFTVTNGTEHAAAFVATPALMETANGTTR